MPPNPPSNAHGFAMRSMSLRDMEIPKSEKNNSCPPPPKSWGRPCYRELYYVGIIPLPLEINFVVTLRSSQA